MGAKATIAAIVPSSTHISASQASGRSPATLHLQAQTQITDCINMLTQVVKDMIRGNPGDANITTLNTVITNLS